VSNVHRKHPLSVAIPWRCSPRRRRLPGRQTSPVPRRRTRARRTRATQRTDGARRQESKSGDGSARSDEELQELTVTGVRESQIRAIEVKRLAPSIQDSISAESIGQLPDVTITDVFSASPACNQPRRGVGTRWTCAA